MTESKFLRIVMWITGGIGWVWLGYLNWKIAIGVLVVMWSNNLQNKIKNDKE